MWIAETIDLDNHDLVIEFMKNQSDKIKKLEKENEQLKKREEQLLSEIEDFQQLLTKKDNICYKRAINLIDTQIKNGEEAIEWGKNMNADYGAIGFHIEMLKKIKKELQE